MIRRPGEASDASGLCRAAGIGDPQPRFSAQPSDQMLCLRCRKPVEKIDGEHACRVCRKKPVSTVVWPGSVTLAQEKDWQPDE